MDVPGPIAPGGLRFAVLLAIVTLLLPLGAARVQPPGAAARGLPLPPVLHLQPGALPPVSSVLAPGAPSAGTDTVGSLQSPVAGRFRLVWPLSGIVTSPFGWRIHPIFGTREFHTGLDIATRWGAPVLAARSGIVRFAGWMAGYGELIVVDHGNGLETAYSHLSAMEVRPGAPVTRGQTIGRVGNTGWSTGPHLFFEVRRNGTPIDPARYLN